MSSSTIGFKIESCAQRLSGLQVAGATLHGVHVFKPASPENRVDVRNLQISDCRHDGCFIHGALIRDAEISNLRGCGRLGSWLRGCLYSGVLVRGRISGIEIRSSISGSPEEDEIFDHDAARFYASVPLALDITEASFDGFTVIEGVPANLVKINSAEHFILWSNTVNDIPPDAKWLKIIAKAAASTPGGVVFSLNGTSDRAKRQREQCLVLRQSGLLG